jgi:Phage terminase-like protein, large subunit
VPQVQETRPQRKDPPPKAGRGRRRAPEIADPATDYARAVDAGQIVAGPWVRLACKRHLQDLVEGPKRGLTWRPDLAARVYEFFAGLRLADGDHAGAPFYLEPWQCFVVGLVFGWVGADGYRRFRTAYEEIGKGNGKTPLAAGVGLYMLVADGEQGAEVYSAAVSRDQAGICFRDAKRFVEVTPALQRRLRINENNIAYPASGSFFRPLSAEGKTLDGKRVHCAIGDEVHEHSTSVVVDKLRAGTKGRRQALIWLITNSGTDRESVCYQFHDYGVRVLRGDVIDDSFFAYICALDEGDDWMNDRACWPKANPNLGVSIHEKYLAEQVHEARGMPAKQNLIARLNFCVWTDAESAWMSREKWDAVQVAPDRGALRDRKCFVGLDLSSHLDLTAAAFFFPDDKGGGDAFVEFWKPADNLADCELADRVPYQRWLQDKFLHVTPGASVDYGFVARDLADLLSACQLQGVVFDRWGIKRLMRELERQGIDHWLDDGKGEQGRGWRLVPFGQGFRDMTPAVNASEEMIVNGKIRIHRNPVLTWNAASVVLVADDAGNRKFTKRKAHGRIDGIVALAMAIAAAIGPTNDDSAAFAAYLDNPVVV